MKTKRLLFQAAFIALLSLLPAVKAKAEPFVFITPPERTGYVGTTVDFYGFVFNGGEETIAVGEASGGHESDLFGFLINTDPFYNNPGFDLELRAFVLEPGEDTGLIKLFSVEIAPFAIPDLTFFGFFFVFDDQDNVSNLGIFSITPQAVPEPATMILLGSGLAGGWATLKRRRRKEAAK